MSVSRPRSISMSSAGRSSQKGRRPSFLNDKGEVRLVENGFDLTPLPLLVDEAPPEEEAVVAEREVETTTQNDDEEETGTLWSSSYYSESGSDEESVEKVRQKKTGRLKKKVEMAADSKESEESPSAEKAASGS